MKDPRWFEEGPGSEDPADRILRHIRRYYVVGAARMPADLPPISQEVGRFYGACNHPTALQHDWLFRSDGFTADAVPEGFSLVGMTDVGRTEHVVLMWRQGGRCFWFRDEQASVLQPRPWIPKVRRRMQAAVERWDAGSGDVWAGPRGDDARTGDWKGTAGQAAVDGKEVKHGEVPDR